MSWILKHTYLLLCIFYGPSNEKMQPDQKQYLRNGIDIETDVAQYLREKDVIMGREML